MKVNEINDWFVTLNLIMSVFIIFLLAILSYVDVNTAFTENPFKFLEPVILVSYVVLLLTLIANVVLIYRAENE